MILNAGASVPQPSPHYVEQQQNSNSSDLMSVASTQTQQSIADASMASSYTQGSNRKSHQRGSVSGAAPTPPRRKNLSSYQNRDPRVSPKRPGFGSASKKRRELASANSGKARGSKHSVNRRKYSKSPLPQDSQQNQLSTTNDDYSLPPPMNLFNTKSDNQLDASQTAVQRTASATNKYEGPAYRVLRDHSDQPSSSKDTPPCILNRLMLAGAQSLLLDADAVEKISNDFKDIDITDAVLSMDILSSDYLISKLREHPNTPEVWESLNPQVVASYFYQVLSESNDMHDLKKVKEKVEKSLKDSNAESKLLLLDNFHTVLAAIMEKRADDQQMIEDEAEIEVGEEQLEFNEIQSEIDRLQIELNKQRVKLNQKKKAHNKEQATTTLLKEAGLKSVRHVNEEIRPLRNRVAGVKSQSRVIATLSGCVETETLPSASLIQSVLDFNLPFDPQFENKLRGILTVCQADGQSIRTGTSQTTTHSIRELLDQINVSGSVPGGVPVPVLEVLDEVMEDMSVLGLTVATDQLIPEHEPQAVGNYNASTTGTELSTDMPTAAAASDDVRKPSTGDDSVSVTSDAMTLKTIDSITGGSSVKAPAASSPVKAPSLPEVEDVSVDGSESSKLGLKHTNIRPNKAAGDSWMTPLLERDGCD